MDLHIISEIKVFLLDIPIQFYAIIILAFMIGILLMLWFFWFRDWIVLHRLSKLSNELITINISSKENEQSSQEHLQTVLNTPHYVNYHRPEALLSVVILSSGDFDLTQKSLTALYGQQYPSFDIIIVLENSNPELEGWIQQSSLMRPQKVRIVYNIPKRGEIDHRLSLILGIRASRSDWVVLTTEGCCPSSKEWLQRVSNKIDNEHVAIVGYVKALHHTFSYHCKQTHYLSYANKGKALGADLRNLALKRSALLNPRFFYGTSLSFTPDGTFIVERLYQLGGKITAEASESSIIISNENIHSKNIENTYYPRKWSWIRFTFRLKHLLCIIGILTFPLLSFALVYCLLMLWRQYPNYEILLYSSTAVGVLLCLIYITMPLLSFVLGRKIIKKEPTT